MTGSTNAVTVITEGSSGETGIASGIHYEDVYISDNNIHTTVTIESEE